MGRRVKHTYIQMFIAALLIITLLVPADLGEDPGTENVLPWVDGREIQKKEAGHSSLVINRVY